MEIKKKSVIPIYSIGAVWLLYSLALPLYRTADYLIAAALSALVFFILRKTIPNKTIYIEAVYAKSGSAEADAAVLTGKGYLGRLRALHKKIENPKIKGDAERLLETGDKILDFISKNPESARQADTFLDYYFPTALKLLDSYAEMSGQPVRDGGNIDSTMERIASAMESVALVFQKQLDGLYEHKSMDIRTDIAVLQNIVDSEGYGSK